MGPSRAERGPPVTGAGCCGTPGEAVLREGAANRGGTAGDVPRPLAVFGRQRFFCTLFAPNGELEGILFTFALLCATL